DLPANLLPLRAPFAGVLLKRDITVGELVTPTQPQFTLADNSRLWLLLDVHLEDAARVRQRNKVAFAADSTDQEASGQVSWVSPEADAKTRTVRVRVVIANPKGDLRPATFGTGQIEVRQVVGALTVPDVAIQSDGKAYRVFVQVEEEEKKSEETKGGGKEDKD